MRDHIGEEFLAKTRYEAMGPSDQARGLPQPPLEMAVGEGAEFIDLSRPEEIEVARVDLTAAIGRRVSVRDYSRRPLTLAELSYLLWCSQGVREVVEGRATLRTVPSAGGRHAFETYLLINRVEPLAAGLYRFLAVEHKLGRVGAPGGAEARLHTTQPWHPEPWHPVGEMVAACLGQEFVAASAATFVWAADACRMTWRYGQRGYRYLFLDAGHVCQNLYLAAEAIGCGVCAIGAFDDERVNAVLGLDGRKQFAVYLGSVGKR